MFWKQLNFVICLSVIVLWCIAISNSSSLQTVAPLNPVKEGDILSLRCQVWNLGANEAVKISRHSNTNSQVFSYHKGLIGGIDERVFLAIRQLRDGSTVYFLSIIDVKQDDEGEFSCKIMNMRHDKVVAESSVLIKTMFFPESSPTCYPHGPLAVNAGSTNTVNCSSEKGNPPVDIEWVRAGTDGKLSFSEPETIRSTIFSLLTIKPQMQDRDAMYICRITSKHFPEESRTCTVGPLSVHPSSNPLPIAHYMVTRSPEPEVVTSRVKYGLDFPIDRQRCEEYCQRSSVQSLHFWVVCTGVAAVFAIVFFVIGIILLIKYRSTTTKPKVQYVSHHQGHDDMYTELKMRHDANKVYMAITKPPDEMVYCPNENDDGQEQQVIELPEHKVRYVVQ